MAMRASKIATPSSPLAIDPWSRQKTAERP
jgi:hypothetical protein